jgi:hypothetical protein
MKPVDVVSEPRELMPIRRGRWLLIGGLLFLSMASIYAGLIFYLDNTNLETTNGLWKSPWVHAWELGTGRPVDTGDLLYIPAYGFLCRLIPDRAVSYGVHGEVVVYRKMALLNALFSALASLGVFLLALRFTSSLVSALVVTLAHSSSGFVLLHSLNSEDVTPAYAFFVGAVLFLFEYTRTRKLRWLVLCAGFLALVTLFHWTLMIPALAAVGSVFLALVVTRRHRVWVLVVFPLLFLGMLAFGSLVLRALDPSLRFSVWQLLYPSKAAPNGYLGFRWNKLVYAALGIGNYFSGARYLGDYRFLVDPNVLRPAIVSWIYSGLTVGACAWALVSRGVSGRLRLLAGFCGLVFAVGELEHLYSQPQDPQSQIQPMFVSVAGLIIFFCFMRRKLPGPAFRLVAAVLALGFFGNGLWNLNRLSASRGADSRNVAAIRELRRVFPPGRVTRIAHAIEPWNTWWYLEVHRGDWNGYVAENILLFTIFADREGISGAGAAGIVKKRIAEAFAAGRRVVACSLWTEGKADFVGLMAAVSDGAEAAAFYDTLHGAYSRGQTWETPVGRFVELLPAAQDPN